MHDIGTNACRGSGYGRGHGTGGLRPRLFSYAPTGLELELYTSHRGFAPTTNVLRPDGDCPPPLSFCEKVGILLEVEKAVAALARGLHQVAVGTELFDHVVGSLV